MTDTLVKPDYFGEPFASRFRSVCVAELYAHRPPYTQEAFTLLRSLITDTPRIVLDAGCGTGKIVKGLASTVERVDAVDCAEEMIRFGKSSPHGNAPQIRWICSALETAPLSPPYALITAGESLHWFDWQVVFPLFARLLTPHGFLAIVTGAEAYHPPWQAARKRVIQTYSTNPSYAPFNTVRYLVEAGVLTVHGEQTTAPLVFTQTVDEYILSEHSRSSLSLEAMGADAAAQFDADMRNVLAPYQRDGMLQYEVCTTIIWGKPHALSGGRITETEINY
jgi:SAM-dependent methyltransferase